MNRFLCIIFLFFAFSFQSLNAGPLKLLQSTRGNWVSGAPGGRSGTTYTILLKIVCNPPVEFTGLWLNGKEVSFDVGAFSTDPGYKVKKGDTLTISANLVNAREETIQQRKIPVKAKGEGLLEYKTAKGFKYVAINKFDVAEPILGQ